MHRERERNMPLRPRCMSGDTRRLREPVARPTGHSASGFTRAVRGVQPVAGGVYADLTLVLSGRFRRALAESAKPERRLGIKKVLAKLFSRKDLPSAEAVSLADE